MKAMAVGAASVTAFGAASAAAAAAIKSFATPALGVEDAMAKVATVITPAAGSVQDALAATKAAAIDWSKKHVDSVNDFLDASYNMNSAGLNSVQSIAGTQAALTLARATMGDATTASNLLATMYNNLGDKSANAATEMMRLGDVLAKTQALYQIKDLQQLNEGLKMGTPSAKQFGVSIEQLSTVIGALNTAGLQGSMAGTAFYATMRQMGKASKALGFDIKKTADGGVDLIGTVGNIEKKFGSFAQMSDDQKGKFQQFFGDEGIRAISLMLGKTGELAADLRKVGDAAGTAAAAQGVIEGTRSGALQIMGNRIDAIKLKLAESLLPALEKVVPYVNRIIDAVDGWASSNGTLLGGGFGKFIDTGITAIGAFAAGFRSAWPAISQALQGLAGAFSGTDWVGTIKDVATTLGKVTAAAVGLAAVVGGSLLGLANVLGAAWVKQIGLITGAWDFLIAGVGRVILWFDDLRAKASFALDGLVAGAKQTAAALIDGLVSGIKSGAVWVLDAIKNLGSSAVSALKSLLGISSPSKVFAGLGEATGNGFAVGIETAMPKTIRAPELEHPRMATVGAFASGPLAMGEHWGRGFLGGETGTRFGSDLRASDSSIPLEPAPQHRPPLSPLAGMGNDPQLEEIIALLKQAEGSKVEVNVKAPPDTVDVKQPKGNAKKPIRVTSTGGFLPPRRAP